MLHSRAARAHQVRGRLWRLGRAGGEKGPAAISKPVDAHTSHPCPPPCASNARWLGLTAFLRVLRRKQARYTALLAALQELADAPGLRGVARQLAPVVDPARSSAFDAILY